MKAICSHCMHFHSLYMACWCPQNTEGEDVVVLNKDNECSWFMPLPDHMLSKHPIDRLPRKAPYAKLKGR